MPPLAPTSTTVGDRRRHGLLFTIGMARCPDGATMTTTASAADVPAVCAFLLELDAGVAALGDPTADTAASTVAQLDAVIPLFEEAAAKAPPEVAGDLEGLAAGFTEIRAIVAEIEAQGSQPTPEQMQQLQSIEDVLGPFVEGLATWAEANCAGPAPAVAAAPSFTG